MTSYTIVARTLRGSVYNLLRHEDSYGRTARVNLTLRDSTFFSHADCLFITDAEQEMLTSVQLGDEVTIWGQATLLNGRPVLVVDPHIES